MATKQDNENRNRKKACFQPEPVYKSIVQRSHQPSSQITGSAIDLGSEHGTTLLPSPDSAATQNSGRALLATTKGAAATLPLPSSFTKSISKPHLTRPVGKPGVPSPGFFFNRTQAGQEARLEGDTPALPSTRHYTLTGFPRVRAHRR